jgi:hypothetical protein
MKTVLIDLLQIIGELVLGLMPDLADSKTRELMERAHWPFSLTACIGLKFVISMACLVLGFIAAAISGEVITLLLAIPAAICGWLLPNFFLASYARNGSADQ